MQIKTHIEDGNIYECFIPNENIEVIPGVPWGCVSRPFTPAYWRLACIASGAINDIQRYHLGRSLEEEVVACLLGGHSVTGEMGLAAFNHLRHNRAIEQARSINIFESLLKEPLNVGGKLIRYRFPKQKAKYITAALAYLDAKSPPLDSGKSLRNWLTAIPGIGNKTASWIARNWLDAQDVAIIDIHIHRAGVIIGIFNPNDDVSKDYLRMEECFLRLAEGISIPSNILDHQIWNDLRVTPSTVRKMLTERGVKSTDLCGLPPANNRSTSRNYKLFTST